MSSAQLSLALKMNKQVASAATAALAGIVCFAAMIMALHALRPDLNPVLQPTSEYAVGPYSYLMTSAFLSVSVASFALLLALSRGLGQAARSRMGLGLLGVWGGAVLIAMIFPIDPYGAPLTLSGTIHRINGPIAFLSLTVAVILVSRRFKHDQRWRGLQRPALILSLMMLALFVGTVVNIATEAGYAGLFQRLYLATFVTWFLLTAARLRSLATEPVSA